MGPEHAELAADGRATYGAATDDEALAGFQLLCVTEGILPALESAHAIGWLAREAGHAVPSGSTVLLTLSGRGDKDVAQIVERLTGEPLVVSLEAGLREARADGQALLVPYITGGLDDQWLDVARAVAAAGANAIEIGIPFSDPVMDGPTIQLASERALARGTTPASVITEAARLDIDVPLAVMTYVNLVGHMGYRRFAAVARGRRHRRCDPARPAARRARPLGGGRRRPHGGDSAARRAGHPRRPVARDLRPVARGFVYGVSLMGVTGERESLAAQASEMGRRCKAVTDTPVLLGVGISNAAQAVEAARYADGVVVGSALVQPICSTAVAPTRRTSSWPDCGRHSTPTLCSRRRSPMARAGEA